MKRKLISLFLVILFVLTGCSNVNENDIQKDYQSLHENQPEELQSEKEGITIPQHMEYELSSKSGKRKMTINADVVSAGIDSAGVFDAELVQVDDEYMKSLAEALFDGGQYTIKKPYLICNVDELNAEMEKINEEPYRIDPDDENYRASEAFFELVNLLEEDEESINKRAMDMKEGQVVVHIEHSGRYYMPEDSDPIELTYDIGMIEGKVQKRDYQLYYINTMQGTSLKLRLMECDVAPSSLFDVDTELYDSIFGENKCDLETARTTASDIISRLGYDDFHEVSAAQVFSNRYETETPYLDGYYFYYAPTLNGVESQVYENDNSISVTDREAGMRNYAQDESICVKVNHYGLSGVSFGSHYHVGSKLSEQTELLEFDKVNEIAKERMLDIMYVLETQNGFVKPDYVTRNWYYPEKIDKIQFDYVPMHYEGKYVFVPAWLYLCDYYSNWSQSSEFCNMYVVTCVNALDGSLIHLDYSEQYSLSPYWFEPY